MKNSSLAFTIFKRSIAILFIIFMILYFQVETGEHNGQRNDRKIPTGDDAYI